MAYKEFELVAVKVEDRCYYPFDLTITNNKRERDKKTIKK